MSNPPIRIMLVDDHKIVREAWKMLLENNPRFHVISVCENGQSAIEEAQKLNPDIMLIDVNMSPVNGFTVTEKIMELNLPVKIIGLSINNQSMYANRMFDLGARGFITKTSSLEEVNHGILEVYKGERYMCKEVRKNMLPGE
jgi:two-component system, NarL family, invasion response regulator UvrY